MRARAFSLRGVQELSLVSVLRTMLLAEAAEEEEGEGGEGEVSVCVSCCCGLLWSGGGLVW